MDPVKFYEEKVQQVFQMAAQGARFTVYAHGGENHHDDVLALALLHLAGLRVNVGTFDEALKDGRPLLMVDYGYPLAYYAPVLNREDAVVVDLKDVYIVDHHALAGLRDLTPLTMRNIPVSTADFAYRLAQMYGLRSTPELGELVTYATQVDIGEMSYARVLPPRLNDIELSFSYVLKAGRGDVVAKEVAEDLPSYRGALTQRAKEGATNTIMRAARASLEELIKKFGIPARVPDDVGIYANKPANIFDAEKKPVKTVDVGLFDVLLYARNPKLFEDLVSSYFKKLEEDIASILSAKFEDIARDFTTASGWSGRAFVIPRQMSIELAKKVLDFGIVKEYIDTDEMRRQRRTGRHVSYKVPRTLEDRVKYTMVYNRDGSIGGNNVYKTKAQLKVGLLVMPKKSVRIVVESVDITLFKTDLRQGKGLKI